MDICQLDAEWLLAAFAFPPRIPACPSACGSVALAREEWPRLTPSFSRGLKPAPTIMVRCGAALPKRARLNPVGARL